MKFKKPIIHITRGPSLTVPYKAVIIQYENYEDDEFFVISMKEKDLLRSILPDSVKEKINFDHIENIDNLLIELMRAFINIRDILNLEIDLKTNDKNEKLICLEYLHQDQVTPPINAAFGITAYIKSNRETSQQDPIGFINLVTENSLNLAPKMAVKNMLLGAKKLNIPYYPIYPTGGIYSYGQGKNSIFFNFASSQFDSQIGGWLQEDKAKTNMFLKLLGYSTTEQRIVNSIEQCHEAVKQLGGPVVIKPSNGAKGIGVTANINHIEQVPEAFNVANADPNGNVIVEKFIEGDAHRLAVSNGEVIYKIVCSFPPFVIGDGKSTINELIKIENERRNTPDKNEITMYKIKLNETMKKQLDYVGMNENSIPEKSLRVNLLNTSNAVSGGKLTLVDKKDVHPDNLKMAIDITRLFRLNCSGIDFITTDISRSWREVGTVIEVNSHPGVNSEQAIGVLNSHFANNNDRIDSTLILTNNDDFSKKIIKEKNKDGSKVGYADNNTSSLNSEIKRTTVDDLYNNCRCLLIHPDCDKIVVSMTIVEIVTYGLPLDYFEHLIIDPDCQSETDINDITNFLKNHVGKITNSPF